MVSYKPKHSPAPFHLLFNSQGQGQGEVCKSVLEDHRGQAFFGENTLGYSEEWST